MDYAPLKMGQEVLMVSSQKKKKNSGICMNGLTKHIQNLRQFTRWDSNPREYEALIYTNIQLICSDTRVMLRVSLRSKHLSYLHISYIVDFIKGS